MKQTKRVSQIQHKQKYTTTHDVFGCRPQENQCHQWSLFGTCWPTRLPTPSWRRCARSTKTLWWSWFCSSALWPTCGPNPVSSRPAKESKEDDDDNDVDTAAIARRGNNSAELRLHRLAGYVLAFFVLCHVFAVRIAVLGGAWEKTLLALAFSWAESPTTNTIQMKGRSKGWS